MHEDQTVDGIFETFSQVTHASRQDILVFCKPRTSAPTGFVRISFGNATDKVLPTCLDPSPRMSACQVFKLSVGQRWFAWNLQLPYC